MVAKTESHGLGMLMVSLAVRNIIIPFGIRVVKLGIRVVKPELGTASSLCIHFLFIMMNQLFMNLTTKYTCLDAPLQ